MKRREREKAIDAILVSLGVPTVTPTPAAREEYLRPWRREVEIYTDCAAPGKPVWHDDRRLVRTMSCYTGYTNSTPVASWTDKQKLTRWRFLKTRARTNLRRAEGLG